LAQVEPIGPAQLDVQKRQRDMVALEMAHSLCRAREADDVCARKRLRTTGRPPSRAMGLSSTSKTFGASWDSSAAASSNDASALSTRTIWVIIAALGNRCPVSQFATAERVTCSRFAICCWDRPFQLSDGTVFPRSGLPWLLATPFLRANGYYRLEAECSLVKSST
jgi:hypothetical protein